MLSMCDLEHTFQKIIAMSTNIISSSSKYTENYGTPPSSPATMSAFSKVIGAATTIVNKQISNQTQIQTQTQTQAQAQAQTQTQAQNQNTGNPLGIAVLLQGAQAGSAGCGSSSGSSNNSQNSQVGASPSSPVSVSHQANGSNEPIASRRQDSSSIEWEVRRMSDAGRHTSRMDYILDEDLEDGKRTVDARKLGINARERSTQQPPCWNPTSCGLL